MINITKKDSIYIHIPFCKEKCFYCNFISFANKDSLISAYVEALIKEIEHDLSKFENICLESIYIGGGTPTLISVGYIKQIIKTLEKYSKINESTEITIETNPGTADKLYFYELKNIGVNRISIGAQSFNDDVLKSLNRIHSKNQIIETVNICRNVGIDNISLDLIYGLPGQTLEDWLDSLNEAIKLGVTHISAYGLKIEENTHFGNHLPENLPDEDDCAEMYVKTIELLRTHNYFQYEISNYSKKGYKSKHNLRYWQNQEYFGFGLSSHGYINNNRYSNTENLDRYLKDSILNRTNTVISVKDRIEEAIFLGLRLNNGINLALFQEKYDYDLYKNHKKSIDKFINYKCMTIENNHLKLTHEGFLLSNNILSEFIQ